MLRGCVIRVRRWTSVGKNAGGGALRGVHAFRRIKKVWGCWGCFGSIHTYLPHAGHSFIRRKLISMNIHTGNECILNRYIKEYLSSGRCFCSTSNCSGGAKCELRKKSAFHIGAHVDCVLSTDACACRIRKCCYARFG